MLDLSKIDEATEADKRSGLVYWAEMFRAGNWEDLITLAEGRKDLEAAVMTMYSTTADQHILSLMEGHERYLRDRASANSRYERTSAKLKEATAALNETETKLDEAKAKLDETEVKLGETESKLGETEAKLGETESKLGETEVKLDRAEAELEETKTRYDDLVRRLKEKDRQPLKKRLSVFFLKLHYGLLTLYTENDASYRSGSFLRSDDP